MDDEFELIPDEMVVFTDEENAVINEMYVIENLNLSYYTYDALFQEFQELIENLWKERYEL